MVSVQDACEHTYVPCGYYDTENKLRNFVYANEYHSVELYKSKRKKMYIAKVTAYFVYRY